jgi:ribonucleoside-diphosphate reductase alpha chain
MKEGSAYQAAGTGQQPVEGGSTSAPVASDAMLDTGKPRAVTRPPGPGSSRSTSSGLSFPRFFTEEGVDPFDEVEWELRAAVIGNERGEVVFEQRDVEIPKLWSQQATNIVVSKYFRGQIGSPGRERSVRQLVGRVVSTITEWARAQKYFASESDLGAFSDDLKHILIYQKAAFNSPVWFNCGFETAPQCSACFINSVEDTMGSILSLAKTEGMLFKFGSGTGTNLSPIRSSKELLAGGGTASGPVSFMKGYDAFAGVIKSGGKTRRAAKMVILNADHPDIVEFINCKVEEEKKAWALIDAGYDGSFTGPAYSSVFFQNSNNSVRVTDDFMRAVLDDGKWETHAVTDPDRTIDTYDARDLMRLIAEGTHVCGDPGMQFDTTINEWHTCPETDRIYASNPCSEYMFLNDSACNLASINLMKLLRADGEFDVVAYKAAIRTLITAQEIIVDNASYPTDSIGRNSHAYRPLGLGYANLGALLMSRGLPYDSDAGRDYAAALTALMTGEAYAQSARVARDHGGPFAGYDKNREPFLRVMRKHRDALRDVNARNVPSDLYAAARSSWDDAVDLGEQCGFRNAQATVLAPTGTIGFMMDCDTTGVEPDIALVKYKKLVGGGLMKIVNQTVPMALRKLGYTQPQVEAIVEYIDKNETIEGAPGLKDSHLPVFDCAFKAAKGSRSIHYMGHIKMMGATQPFISGAISKTVNVPKEATIDEIMQAYVQAWKLGAKAISIYRDGSKRTQPLNTSKDKVAGAADSSPAVRATTGPVRRKLPDERKAITHKFDIAGHEGYITVGLFEDGQPGEIFLVMAKEGSTISGFADAFAQAISYALQYGVPLQALVDKFSHVRFEPSGMTRNPEIRFAKSIVDYIFRWLATKFLSPEAQFYAGVNGREIEEAGDASQPAAATDESNVSVRRVATTPFSTIQNQEDAPPCSTCGSIMIRSGACYKCVNCGNTSGCA